MEWVSLIGRVIFGGYFVMAGFKHFINLGEMAGYAGSKGVPAPKLAVAGSGLLLVVGGALVALGWWVSWGCWLIIAFLVPVSFMMHDFWTVDDPAQKQAELVNFTKNWGLIGAALMIASVPYWPMSLQQQPPQPAPGTEIVQRR